MGRDKQLLIHIVRKSTPRFTKSPSLVLIRLVFDWDTAILKVKIDNKMFGHPDTASRWPYISLYILTFSNGCNWLTIGSIYTKLGDFVKLGLHILWLCGSIVGNPIIYRHVPSPSQFEIRQWFPAGVSNLVIVIKLIDWFMFMWQCVNLRAFPLCLYWE